METSQADVVYLRVEAPSRRLRAEQLGHVISRVRSSEEAGKSTTLCARCMHWAIDAYANAEWRRTNRRWKSLSDFFMSETYDVWLERSEKYQRHVE